MSSKIIITDEARFLGSVFLDEVLSHDCWRWPWSNMNKPEQDKIRALFNEYAAYGIRAAREDEREKIFRRIDALKQQLGVKS